VHVYALSIGASVLLSFFPFLIVMLTLIRDVLHFPAAERALIVALGDYFPGELGAFIIRNLTKVNHGRFQLTSLLLLTFTANGIFEPLEVALNRAWHVPNNRSYIRNQVLSFCLILLCGGLALASVLLSAMSTKFVATQYGIKVFPVWLSLGIFKVGAIPMTILSLVVIYWVLPNRRIPVRRVLPVAVLVGIALEALKYLFLFAWPWMGRKFQNEYGPFYYAVSVVVFGVLAAFIVLAGAEWSARPLNEFDEPAQS
jgi:YihY family inner membrane protein